MRKLRAKVVLFGLQESANPRCFPVKPQSSFARVQDFPCCDKTAEVDGKMLVAATCASKPGGTRHLFL